MTQTNDPDARLGELQSLLEVHGSDRTRWPAAARLRLASFVASNPLGQAALQEAAALDRLLDMAPRVSIEREQALALRIQRAASDRPRPSQTSQTVVPLRRSVTPNALSARGLLHHAGAALLAASLVLGIFAGTSGQLVPTVDALAEAIGLADDEPELALISEPSTNGEES